MVNTRDVTVEFLRTWAEISLEMTEENHDLDKWREFANELVKVKKWERIGDMIKGVEEDRTWTAFVEEENVGRIKKTQFKMDIKDSAEKVVGVCDMSVFKNDNEMKYAKVDLIFGENKMSSPCVTWEFNRISDQTS